MDSRREKEMDVFIRAVRVEEMPLLQTDIDQKVKEHSLYIEETFITTVARVTLERKHDQEVQTRLSRMRDDRDVFLNQIQAHRHAVYLEDVKAFDKALQAEKELRLQIRKTKRKDERKLAWEKAQAAEAKKKDEEEKRKCHKQAIMWKEQQEKVKQKKSHKK